MPVNGSTFLWTIDGIMYGNLDHVTPISFNKWSWKLIVNKQHAFLNPIRSFGCSADCKFVVSSSSCKRSRL